MSVVLLVHLSDAHIRTDADVIIKRAVVLAQAIAAEVDGLVKGCILAFTGDAIDQGYALGFGVAKQFLSDVSNEVEKLTKLRPVLLLVPGNHDVVRPVDPSLRDLAISSLTGNLTSTRPQKAVEAVILAPQADYFTFANSVAPGSSPSHDQPYYCAVDSEFDGKRIRFHLLNSAWMCAKGQEPGDLLFPVGEIRPPKTSVEPDYEVTLLHHPFNWFKQPDTLRPLRDAIEPISDMVLTGHEHVGRSMTTAVHGGAAYEYSEGEALQEGNKGQISGFHVVRLDFQRERQTVTTYRWSASAAGAYLRSIGPVETVLGRNRRRAAQPYRFLPKFEAMLDDPELPVLHSKQGMLHLADFYTYPDLKPLGDDSGSGTSRLRGEDLVQTIGQTPRSLLIGPDRCGKTSLTKRLCADLHRNGDLPLLLRGGRVKNIRMEQVSQLVERLVEEQYEVLKPEAYWQTDPSKWVLIIDDLHEGPEETDRRSLLLAEIQRRFKRIVVVSNEEFYYEEFLSADLEDRRANPIWDHKFYRILPFGYQRCEQFVRNWVGLGQTKPIELEDKIKQISCVLTQFLRHNLIPQFPWVVMIIVQQADSAEPLHGENGSYGYLLQALITAALAKSRLNHPVTGKYAWLGELANEMYRRNHSILPEDAARKVHERYCNDYGVTGLDYKDICNDLATAGVLRIGGGEVSFRQDYTYCFFVAWHLAQRLHAEDAAARDAARNEVKGLCTDLYHEDTANVLVFLAHLTTSHVVLEEMTKRAAQLFAGATESDFTTDTEPINNLYQKAEALILPHGDPQLNKIAVQNAQDEKKAERDSQNVPRREVKLRRSPEERAASDRTVGNLMEMVTATRTIEILGQVLRNAATGRKLAPMLEITKEIFRLGRRQLNFLFTLGGGQSLEKMITSLEDHYRQRMPRAKAEKVVNEVSRHLFNLYAFVGFALVKQVAVAVGDKNLREVFRQLVEADPNLANRIYKLAIDLEISPRLPTQDVETLNDELSGKSKGPGNTRTFNNLAHMVVRALVVDYLYLNHVPHTQVQEVCKKLNIHVPGLVHDQTAKRLPPHKK